MGNFNMKIELQSTRGIFSFFMKSDYMCPIYPRFSYTLTDVNRTEQNFIGDKLRPRADGVRAYNTNR